MKSIAALFGLVLFLSSTPLGFSQTKLDVSTLRSVPEGNYLVTLELNGKQERLNFVVQGEQARCVNSTRADLKDVRGVFKRHESGIFLGRFQGGSFRGSQLWIFRRDGAAAIREIPDRGEQQSAVPVKGDSIEAPKEK